MSEKPTYESLEQKVLELEKSDLKRKKAEDALRESEERFRCFFMNAPLPYQSLDENGNFIEVNSTFLELLGYSRDKVIGKNFGDFLHPDYVAHFKENFPRFKAVGEVLGVEFEMVKKDGSKILVSFNGKIQRDDQSRFQCTHCIFQDITERNRAEELLVNAKKQWEETFDAISDWVTIIDKNNNIFRSNCASKSLVGLSPKQVVGKRCYEIVHGMDYPISDCPIERAVKSKQRESAEIQLKSGRWIMVSVDPIKHENNVELFVHIVRDITDRKNFEAQKDTLEAQKRQIHKAESLGRMAGAIAHNFNNQLQAVIGNLEMAMDDQPGCSETLEEALKAAHKAADISALMLTYSGKQLGKYEPIDLSSACRQSLTLLQAADPKGTIMKADLPASGPVIRSNEGQIHYVLTNLITNAWESGEENRRGIVLTVKTVSKTEIPAFKRFPADWNPQESVYTCLEVVDAGSGIACKDIEKIFDPFFTTKFTGRGMGLSVVLGIVKAHNGGITVVSEPGRGSIFRVFFPLYTEELPRSPDKPIQHPEIQGSGTVLLIEDEEQVRKMARTMLTRLGYSVLEAKDGAEAVEIFQQHQDKICFVLSDLTMPRMNGWDTLAALRKLSPDIPVILSSGYDESHVMAVEHNERPNAFLGKPYRLNELRDTIRHTLADKKKASPGYEPL